MGLKTVAAEAFGIGVLGLNGKDARGAKFGGFLDDEIGARLFDRSEEEPEVGWIALWAGLLGTYQGAAAFAGLGDFGAPFAIGPVEQFDGIAGGEPHHAKKVMRLVPRQRN